MCVKLDGQVIPKDKVVIIMKFIQPRESHHIKLCLSSGQTGGKHINGVQGLRMGSTYPQQQDSLKCHLPKSSLKYI